MFNEIPTLLGAESLQKFHATRKLREETEEEAKATLLVETGPCGQKAHLLRSHLVKLQDNAVWRLVGGQLRGPTMQGRLAPALQRQIYKDYSAQARDPCVMPSCKLPSPTRVTHAASMPQYLPSSGRLLLDDPTQVPSSGLKRSGTNKEELGLYCSHPATQPARPHGAVAEFMSFPPALIQNQMGETHSPGRRSCTRLPQAGTPAQP